MVEDFYANQNLIRTFCNSLIVKDSRKDTGIQLKNSVLKQAKMVTIYQKNNTTDTKKESRNKQFRLSHKSLPFIKSSLTVHKLRT